MSDTLIKVENVSKKFCRNLKRSLWYGIKDLGSELLGMSHENDEHLRKDEFWAVKDVSFELKRGECLGLIGRNGAGKTTLLRMLNGLIKPDKGRIEIRGRVGALIALGAGFNPILTGRENIYINASVLGINKREIDKKIDEIIDFAELREFIDSPVQSYSSGMAVRLGFAVATALNPDVLLLDEILAVGDAGFRMKCYNNIYDICKNACVIFVSHSMPNISRLCSSAILLEQGKEKVSTRETGPVIEEYYKAFKVSNSSIHKHREVMVDNFTINGLGGPEWQVKHGEPFIVHFEMRIPSEFNELEIALSFLNPSMELLSSSNNCCQRQTIQNNGDKQSCTITIDNLLLGSGKKILSFSIVDCLTNEILYWAYAFGEVFVSNDIFIPAPVLFHAAFNVKPIN